MQPRLIDKNHACDIHNASLLGHINGGEGMEINRVMRLCWIVVLLAGLLLVDYAIAAAPDNQRRLHHENR